MKGKSIMITFDGKITSECLKKLNKIRNIELTVVVISILVAFCITNIIAVVILKNTYFSLVIVTLCTLGVLPLLAIKLHRRYRLYDKISIDIVNNAINIRKGNKKKQIPINDINEIHDMGMFYYLPETTDIVLCQKSLLVEGTIEEFEKLFEGKIIKK